MTVTKFPSTHTPIAAALQAAFAGVAFANGAGVVAQSAHAGAGSGEESNRRSFRIPAGPLGPALSRFATRAGARLSFEAPMPAGEQPVELDPITVIGQPLDQGFKADTQESATKIPLSIRETPQSISVITQDSLDARQVQDLGQALETAAAVNVFSGTDSFGGVSPFGFDQTQIRSVSLNGARDIREDVCQ